MVGTVDGALKRGRSHKRKHPRLAVNFEKKVARRDLRLARKEKTTPANIVREVMTAKAMATFPVEFGLVEVQPA